MSKVKTLPEATREVMGYFKPFIGRAYANQGVWISANGNSLLYERWNKGGQHAFMTCIREEKKYGDN